MNPARLSQGFTWEEYMSICYKMIDICDALYFLDNWKDSKGAQAEYEYAVANNKSIYQQVKEGSRSEGKEEKKDYM